MNNNKENNRAKEVLETLKIIGFSLVVVFILRIGVHVGEDGGTFGSVVLGVLILFVGMVLFMYGVSLYDSSD